MQVETWNLLEGRVNKSLKTAMKYTALVVCYELAGSAASQNVFFVLLNLQGLRG